MWPTDQLMHGNGEVTVLYRRLILQRLGEGERRDAERQRELLACQHYDDD